MPGFDPRSFFIIATFVAALCGFLCFVLRQSIPRDIKGLACWGSSCLTMVLASVLFAYRGSVDIFYSSFVANIAVVTGIVLMYSSLRQFCDRHANARLSILLVCAVAVLLVWPTFIEDSYRVRIIIVSGINGALFAASAWVLWRSAQKRFPEYFVLTMLSISGSVSVARGVAAMPPSATAQPLSDASSIQYVYLATFAFSLVALSLGFILMVGKRLQIKLEDAARRDGLTGVSTRSAFEEAARRELAKSLRQGHASSLVMIDLDDFKAINDKFGHRGGDQVLIEFVRLTAAVLRHHDLFGRYGGEEFVVLLPDTSHDLAEQVAIRICEALGQPSTNSLPRFTASIGVATGMPIGDGISELFDQADKALYLAKSAGKNCVRSYSDVMAHDSRESMPAATPCQV